MNRVLGLVLALLLALPAAATAGLATPALEALPEGVPSAVHEPVESTDVPATPVVGTYRLTVLLDERSMAGHAAPFDWAQARMDVVRGYFLADHGIDLVVCRIAAFEIGSANEYTVIRTKAYAAAEEHWNRVSAHTGVPLVDAAGGACEGPWKAPFGADADLLVTLIGKDIYCNGVRVGGCAAVNGGFSMSRDYAASWGEGSGSHPVEHVLQHELSHNFGARDNECQYGIMDYTHTYQSHDWCSEDEAKMTVGKHDPRPYPYGLLRREL